MPAIVSAKRAAWEAMLATRRRQQSLDGPRSRILWQEAYPKLRVCDQDLVAGDRDGCRAAGGVQRGRLLVKRSQAHLEESASRILQIESPEGVIRPRCSIGDVVNCIQLEGENVKFVLHG